MVDPAPSDRLRLSAYVANVSGEASLSDHLWSDLVSGNDTGLLAVLISDLDGPIGYAQLTSGNQSGLLEVVTGRPDEALDTDTTVRLRQELVTTVLNSCARLAPPANNTISWWVNHNGEVDQAAQFGFVHGRQLDEMRMTLPCARTATITTRAFRPGCDDTAWLELNNRAFAAHGEQGGWTHDTLTQRMLEPWFDADGFRLLEDDGVLQGFCWTKVHTHQSPPVGEIYVIAVDPAFHGRGLGSELTLAGLDWLTVEGLNTASLYVDHNNTAAVRTYERLGFTQHSHRHALTLTLDQVTR